MPYQYYYVRCHGYQRNVPNKSTDQFFSVEEQVKKKHLHANCRQKNELSYTHRKVEGGITAISIRNLHSSDDLEDADVRQRVVTNISRASCTEVSLRVYEPFSFSDG